MAVEEKNIEKNLRFLTDRGTIYKRRRSCYEDYEDAIEADY